MQVKHSITGIDTLKAFDINDIKSAIDSGFNLLQKGFPSYESRPQQLEMAHEVYSCLKDDKRLLIEAGTGTGKTFAYLIPAILLKEKTVVSTATKALQEQLVRKDLGFLQKVMPVDFSFGLLKGKNNYVCLKREQEFSSLEPSYKGFIAWLKETRTGDKDELPFIPDFWHYVSGSSEDCSSGDCPFYSNCFYYKHYRSLHNKDIIVINHHLLTFDVLSGGNFLAFHKNLIIDEAHELEDVISDACGNTLNYWKIAWLLFRLKGLKIAVEHLFNPVEAFFRKKADYFTASNVVYPIPDKILDMLEDLKNTLCLGSILSTLERLERNAEDRIVKDKIATTISCSASLLSTIDNFIRQDEDDMVYYMAASKDRMELKSNLVETQKAFQGLVSLYDAVVMTSATLTTGGNFNFLQKRLGIEDYKEKVIPSPFDFKKQALLYIDKELPPPDKNNAREFQQLSIPKIEKLLNASKGRALVLFTSYSHLNFVRDKIRLDYPFKSQGDMPSQRLIEWFKETLHSVIFATSTFWQGIDIKGDKLSLVVIVKMPFSVPTDPVHMEKCKRLKGRWFYDLVLPEAVIHLKQGFGRLIRGLDDRGVVAILDSRVITASYKDMIISSLPEAAIVHSIEAVERFFSEIELFRQKAKGIGQRVEYSTLNRRQG